MIKFPTDRLITATELQAHIDEVNAMIVESLGVRMEALEGELLTGVEAGLREIISKYDPSHELRVEGPFGRAGE